MSYYKNFNTFSYTLGDKEILVETGRFAQQTNGSAVVTIGGTTVLATAVMSAEIREGLDFFPLMVNYQEKLYAAGLIKGARHQKREMRPSDEKILMGRVIDRSIRPLFPKGIYNDVQVILTILSYDGENEHDMVASIATSVALSISDIPFHGPTASVRVGIINEEFVLNPSPEARSKSDLDLIVSSALENVIMIEAGANEIPEEKMLEAIAFGKKWGQKICKFVQEIQEKIGKPKKTFDSPKKDEELLEFITEEGLQELKECLFGIPGKVERSQKKSEILQKIQEKAVEKFGEERDLSLFHEMGDKIWKKLIRDSILKDGKRIAGRKLDEVRSINVEVGVLSRTHGSALFQRGETQGLSVVTLAGPGMALLTDGVEGEKKHYYMHHYNFPPFSTGETSNRLMPGNREIGHGALAERAIMPVLPSREDFPYVIRVVSEILQSNGSSSMAATCGSALSLMDAGVPIKAPVSGIAMGLMVDPENPKVFKILSDIQDEEDFGGDMDFKVAGTSKGITAIQMDTKIMGISEAIFEQAFTQAKKGRFEILEKMMSVIGAPRKELSPYAPRLEMIMIDQDMIRKVIGKGGEVIQKIIAETGCEIEIDDSGKVVVASNNAENMKKAVAWIMGIVVKPEVGKIYEATVKRIEAYGAFAEILPDVQGLIHVSRIAKERVEDVNKYLKLEQKVKVKLMEIDDKGRLVLSMRDAME
ncbi:polyribonucleotide nucleotidyltransferase [Candidatus Peregrinibacteria bacterium]|nr:polyribonucleotide nucleotidyltransferase [Candidatus Peregrinibacteria bacterium]